MKIALLSDTHLHPFTEFDDGGSRLLDCVSVWTEVREYCVEQGIRHVVFGGDLFHKPGVVHTHPYNMIVRELVKWRDAGLLLYAVDGNHDHANRSGAVHNLQALAAAGLMRDISVQQGYGHWRLKEGADRLDVFGFPYCDSRDTLYSTVEIALQAKRRVPTIAVFHHGFKGARVGTSLELQVKEEIDASVFKGKFDYVFSGHYHTRQPIEGLTRASYIGSPMEFTRSDRSVITDTEKGFLVYDSELRAFDVVRVVRPRFVQLAEDDRGTPAWKKEARGNFVDIFYESVDPSTLEKSLRAVGARGVKPIPIVRRKKNAVAQLEITPGMSTRSVLKRYVRYKKDKVREQKLSRNELIRVGSKLISKAEE